MNTTPTPCYCCDEPIVVLPGKHRLLSTFEGQHREVCEDCATGIYGGIETFKTRGVTGEYLGPCGDNEPNK